jgi:phosphoglycerate dehydrogenase-like enzyme
MKYHCAILDDYQQVALTMADWSQVPVHVQSFEDHLEAEDELVRAIFGFEIIVVMRERTPFGESLFRRLPKLKLLITSGLRNASIDVKAATAAGVTVCGTTSASHPPGELTWALILGLARHVAVENECFRAGGPWQTTIGTDLKGKQLGLLGLGKIGSLVARVGIAFGMQVVAWSQNLSKETTDQHGVILASSKEELLRSSDFVSIHLVLSARTTGLIGAAELKSMRPSAYLINTSRAKIVNQAALIAALQNRWIAGVGLDVFEIEPLPADHILRSFPNLLATPHLGYVSDSNYRKYFSEAVEDIYAYLEGSPIRCLG